MAGQRGGFQKLSYCSENEDTWAEKIPLVLMGAERRVKCAQARERGPQSSQAEFCLIFLEK